MCIEQMIQCSIVVFCVVVVLDGVCLACGGMCLCYGLVVTYSSGGGSNASSITNMIHEVTVAEVLQHYQHCL